MGIQFTNGGFLTTVQDMGRIGYQESGMAVSGVMDQRSMALANILVGNDENEGVLEVTLMGPMMKFTEDNIVAVTGGNLGPKLNGVDMPMYQAVLVHAGDTMSFMGMKSGIRAYVAFAGGLDVPVVMGSKSTNLKSKIGGVQGRKIGKDDVIGFSAPKTVIPNLANRCVAADDLTATEKVIRVVMGPQDDHFTDKGIETFLSATYSLTNESDRMGCRFEGDVIEHKNGGDIITDGISFGAIQVPSHGQPIIMMADHQTTGGYTKIANVITVDLPKVAQLRPGFKVKFEKVSVEEAQKLYIDQQKEFQALREKLDTETAKPSASSVAGAVPVAAPVSAGAVNYVAPVVSGKPGKKYRVTVNGVAYDVEVAE